MAGETVIVFGTPKTLEASGGSVANNTVAQANDAGYGLVADGAGFPDARFVLEFSYTDAAIGAIQPDRATYYASVLPKYEHL